MEKVLNGTQEKIMTIFSPLTQLWHIMEQEKNLIPENDEEGVASHNGIALPFERITLLIIQSFNLLIYQRRLNILSTLTDNNTRVKEIPKQETLEMDSIGNMYLFGINLKRSYPK